MKKMLALLIAICFMAFVVACSNDAGKSDSTGGNLGSGSSASSNSEEKSETEDGGEGTNNPFAGGLVNGGTYEGN